MDPSDEISRLWKVNRTIHELVEDRVGTLSPFRGWQADCGWQGFQVSEDEVHMDLATFKQTHCTAGGELESAILFVSYIFPSEYVTQSTIAQLFHEFKQRFY